MLEEITIRNFQNHKKRVVKFDPHVTVLVGRSDSGKSAVLRALGWLLFNRPSGEAFIRDGAKFASVSLWVDGHKITRKRSRENSYFLDGKKFAAFGSSVPSSIEQILNVSDVNEQTQHAPVFWLSCSPGEVSRQLNSVVNLQVIDRSLSHVSSGLRRATTEVDLTRERLRAAKAAKTDLEWVPEFVGKLGNLESLEAEIVSKRSRIAAIASAIKEAGLLVQRARNAAEPIQCGLEAVVVGAKAAKSASRVSELLSLLNQAIQARKDLCDRKSELAEAQARLAKVKKCPVCQKPM